MHVFIQPLVPEILKFLFLGSVYISCKCECTFTSVTFQSNQKWNNYKYCCKCKSSYISASGCKNGKYLESLIDDSLITCDEIIKTGKIVPTKSTSAKIILTKTIPVKITICY